MRPALGTCDYEAVRRLIGQGCLALDDGDFAAFLALCAPDFTYRVRVWSPELKRDMIWLDHDLAGISDLFQSLPEHLQRPGRLSRHVSVYTIDTLENGRDCVVVSSLIVHHTDLEGVTQVLAVCRYCDTVRFVDEAYVLTAREVVPETRDLGIGLHVPL